MANALQHESSPYLLAHADNPVNWYPWGAEALNRAQEEDKPIILSIGYSACHWCQVMKRESFEDPEVAAFMNEHFICIKVDREERPDLDATYLEAVQIILKGEGGWPLNAFLLPDTRAFFGGTYFPPQASPGRSSWMQVLKNILKVYNKHRDEAETQAAKVEVYAANLADFFRAELDLEGDLTELAFSSDFHAEAYKNLAKNFDPHHGGLGQEPKFPSVMPLRYAMYYSIVYRQDEALAKVLFALDKMILGGIYDQLGGGFARYALDAAWKIPHFEKMLYDNAQILGLLAEAYALLPKPRYRQVVEETLAWLAQDMRSQEGAFFAAVNAESEGEEGKYYTWTWAELKSALSEPQLYLLAEFYGLSPEGNWKEGKNVLHCPQGSETDFARSRDLPEGEVLAQLQACRETLRELRAKRPAPKVDDKILLDWNALLISNLAQVWHKMQIPQAKDMALEAFAALQLLLCDAEGKWFQSYRAGQAKHRPCLHAYAYLIQAHLDVYSLTWDLSLLREAETLADYVVEQFYDIGDDWFYYSSVEEMDLPYRRKELYDNTQPSGMAALWLAFQKLGILLDRQDYRDMARNGLLRLRDAIRQYPQSFGQWALAALAETRSYYELAIVGPNYREQAIELYRRFEPFMVCMAGPEAEADYPLLRERQAPADQTLVYLCHNYSCQAPVEEVAQLFGPT